MQAMGRQTESATMMSEREESLTELLGNLANQSASLVRDEVALAKQELEEKLLSLRASVVVMAAGAGLGLLAALALCAAAIAGLAEIIEVWLAALLVGGVLALIAAGTIAYGVRHLKRVNLKPEQTLETLEENKEWLKDLT